MGRTFGRVLRRQPAAPPVPAVLPTLQSRVLITCDDCGKPHQSRVEDLNDAVIWLSAPHNRTAGPPGVEVGLHWGDAKGRHTLPCRVTQSTPGALGTWTLLPTGQVATVQARHFFRVEATCDIDVRPWERELDPGTATRGTLIDMSEGGVRCRVPAGLLLAGEGVTADIDLEGTSVTRTGVVLRVADLSGEHEVAVIAFDPDLAPQDVMRAYAMARQLQLRRLDLD